MGETDSKITEERVESADFAQKPPIDDGSYKPNVQLADGDVTYLIPTPSSDPRGKSSQRSSHFEFGVEDIGLTRIPLRPSQLEQAEKMGKPLKPNQKVVRRYVY